MGVASGAIGGGYGPYSVRSRSRSTHSHYSFDDSITQTSPEMLVSTMLPALVQPSQISH